MRGSFTCAPRGRTHIVTTSATGQAARFTSPTGCATLLNKSENEMAVHIMACLTISFDTSCPPFCQKWCDTGMIQQGCCKAPGAVRSLFLGFSVQELFWFHHIWYSLALITQLLLLICTTQPFKIPTSIVEIIMQVRNGLCSDKFTSQTDKKYKR